MKMKIKRVICVFLSVILLLCAVFAALLLSAITEGIILLNIVF